MRLTAAEKREVIRLVEGSESGRCARRCRSWGVNRATFYAWYRPLPGRRRGGTPRPSHWRGGGIGIGFRRPIHQHVVDAALAPSGTLAA